MKNHKKYILGFVFLFILNFTIAQNSSVAEGPEKLTELLTEKYYLDEKQQTEMLKIQQRKWRNFSEIKPLEKKNPELFIKKIRALQLANDASLKTLFTESQLNQYKLLKVEQRKKKGELFKKLRASGASQTEIDRQIAMLEKEALLKN